MTGEIIDKVVISFYDEFMRRMGEKNNGKLYCYQRKESRIDR